MSRRLWRRSQLRQPTQGEVCGTAGSGQALKGHGAANAELGSAELNLLERSGCPSADDAGKPYLCGGAQGCRGLRSR